MQDIGGLALEVGHLLLELLHLLHVFFFILLSK